MKPHNIFYFLLICLIFIWLFLSPGCIKQESPQKIPQKNKIIKTPIFQKTAGNNLQRTGLSPYYPPTNVPGRAWGFQNTSQIITPLLSDSLRLYSGDIEGRLFCLWKKKGEINWSISSSGLFTARPLLYKDLLISANSTGRLYVIRRDIGQILWQKDFNAPILSSPMVVNQLLYLSSLNCVLYAMDLEKGDIQWTARAKSALSASPASDGENIYICDDSGIQSAYLASTGERLWKNELKLPFPYTNCLLAESLICTFPDGNIFSLDKNNGGILWKKKIDQSLAASPLYYQDKLYFITHSGFLFCLDSHNSKLIFKRQFRIVPSSNLILAPPLLLCAAGKNGLLAFSLDTGKLLWQYQSKGALSAEPYLYKGKIYIGCQNGEIACLSEDYPYWSEDDILHLNQDTPKIKTGEKKELSLNSHQPVSFLFQALKNGPHRILVNSNQPVLIQALDISGQEIANNLSNNLFSKHLSINLQQKRSYILTLSPASYYQENMPVTIQVLEE